MRWRSSRWSPTGRQTRRLKLAYLESGAASTPSSNASIIMCSASRPCWATSASRSAGKRRRSSSPTERTEGGQVRCVRDLVTLPWRGARDPYAVLVSETMLQQTQVARVLEFYPRFLARYPTLEDLAAASADAVRESWEGLGYYARARNLHAAAREVMRRLSGRLPRRPEELRALPGIGRYTAGAGARLAYGAGGAAVGANAAPGL